MATRLGTVALDGILALMQLCIHDSKSDPDFDVVKKQKRRRGQKRGPATKTARELWGSLDEVLDLDAVRFEIDRLADGPQMRELQRLLDEYTEIVHPRWREDDEAEVDVDVVKQANPLFAHEIECADPCCAEEEVGA